MKKIEYQLPVLLIGGLAMKGDELNDLGKRINELGNFPFLTFDNLNVGSGPRIDTREREVSIFDQASHLWQQLEKTEYRDSKISIFGISMGGMIAATMAHLRPERIEKLILSATSANLWNAPAVPNSLYNKWTQANEADEVWDAIAIAFGKTTFEKKPNVPQEYFNYRISGANGQKAKEFVSQVNSIRSFEGERVYESLSEKAFSIAVLSGDEDILFDKTHVEGIKSKISRAECFEFKNTGHMLHLENPVELASKIFQILEG